MELNVRKECFTLGFFGFIIVDYWLLLCNADPQVHFYDFVVEEAKFTRLCSSKSMLTVNGSFPGPTIQVRRGDIVYVNVHNHAKHGLTIHWHGVKQPRNPWSDGPENITQCPIAPGKNFKYEIILSDEEGTLWWHAHSDWTRATVHGAFIVLPPPGTSYPFRKPFGQQTIILGSWFKGDVMEILEQGLANGVAQNLSDAHTINGQPGDLLPCSNTSTFRMFVEHGKTYLLRIISAVMNQESFFGIANHKLTVVGQDGAYIKPITTEYITITPGQTFDILVTANQVPNHYYMAASPFFDSIIPFDNTTATAIFQYNFSTPSKPIPFPELPNITDDDAAYNFSGKIRSLVSKKYPINVPKKINEYIHVTISINQLPCSSNQTCLGPNGNKIAASLNNVSFVIPAIDILGAYYRSLKGVFEKDFPSKPPNMFNFTGDTTNISSIANAGTKVKVLKYMDAVEIVFQGTNVGAAENHPMHIHGYSFYVVGSGFGNFNNAIHPKSFNLVDPPRVNTFAVPKNGWLALRFFADNPGVWFIHCHLERHTSWGMDTVLLVKNGPTKQTSLLPPPPHMPPCSSSC
ncbi:laccase 14 [Euphorbia peplus]|nr:laccase 14 [Euphorbia peplus]